MTKLAEVTFNLAQVAAQSVAGSIVDVSYWYEGAGDQWRTLNPSSPPQLPQNIDLHLMVTWANQSSMTITGRVTLTVTKPDGTILTPQATAYQDQPAAPGNGWMVQFAPVKLDKTGAYTGKAVLESVSSGSSQPTTVSVTLRNRNAPTNARYWAALCNSYPSCPFTPIGDPIPWQNIPAGTPQEFVIFGSYDANYQPLSTPNAFAGVGFSRPFEDGKTYYWDFASGLLLDSNYQGM